MSSKHECMACGKVSQTEANLTHHLHTHTQAKNLSFAMDVALRLLKKRSLKVHLQHHLGIKRFECEWCLKKFVTSYHLKTH